MDLDIIIIVGTSLKLRKSKTGRAEQFDELVDFVVPRRAGRGLIRNFCIFQQAT